MKNLKNYQQLRDELDEIVDWFESAEGFDLELATSKYRQARQIIKQLNDLLTKTELQITKLSAESD